MSLSQLILTTALVFLTMVLSTPSPGLAADKENDARAKRFVEYYEATVRPLEIEAAKLFWTANITGKEEDYQKKQDAEEKLDICLSDPQKFAELKAIKEAAPADPLLARQIDVLYLQYLDKQVDRELLQKMLAKSNVVERAFNVFRPKLRDKELTDNDVRRTLRESRDSAERQAVWEAGKKVGLVVVGDLKELVALRNQAAAKVGFKSYHALQLYCSEQSQEQVLELFDELDKLTRKPFHEAKAEIDAALAKSYGIAVEELRPWHYHDPFFQEAPAVLDNLPESVYKPLDIVKVCRSFYDGIGLPIDDVLNRSSLYEQPGKNPHAFSTDIDRAGDVRILENIVPGHEWLSTSLHELGHAAYSKNAGCGEADGSRLRETARRPFRQRPTVPPSASAPLPYVLHTDAHPLCTEGVAMMFERFAQNVDWLAAMGAEVPNPDQFRIAAAKLRRNRLLVFSRYCQVMFRFEIELYANPDQDLNRLWWDLVEKYQEIKRPEGRNEPDFASKYHFVGAPAYYHNYLLGEMFASQVHHALLRTIMPGNDSPRPLAAGTTKWSGQGVRAGAIYVGNKQAGAFMKQRVFAPGLSLKWNDLTRHATGEDLNPKAFAEDLQTVR
jgi:peptidyl-dipeptidase A